MTVETVLLYWGLLALITAFGFIQYKRSKHVLPKYYTADEKVELLGFALISPLAVLWLLSKLFDLLSKEY